MLFSKKSETAAGKALENVKIQILEEKPCWMMVKVQWGAPEVKKEAELMFERIQREAKLPGFRAGKVPLELVKQNYSQKAKELVIENLLSRGVQRAFEEKNINPASHARVEPVKFLWDQPFTFEFSVDVPPKFSPKDYKKIKIKKNPVSVEGAEVDKELEAIRERNARLVPAPQDPVSKDHFLIVDYEAMVDGKPLPGGKAENQLVSMANPQTITGFTDGLLGAKEGESREIKVTFPTDYFKAELAGKEGVFNVRVREVKTKSLPSLDDEFAKDLGVSSLAEVRERILGVMTQKKKQNEEKAVRDQITTALLEANPIAVPQGMVEEQTDKLVARAYHYLREQGVTDEEWKVQEPKWREQCKKDGENLVRLGYILNSIAKEEKISVSDEEFAQESKKMLDQAGQEEAAKLEVYLEKNHGQIMNGLKEEKIFKFLLENAKIVETVADKVQ